MCSCCSYFFPIVIPCLGRHCEKNYVVIRRSNLRSFILFHEIAASLRSSQ
ncbi:hypothetical protein [Rickettsia felis]|nr:hypothetical protein [Rickettsia felis]